ncbi:MAG: hypothetical protein WDM77_21570 [Steroidobacteraceae bacterium]
MNRTNLMELLTALAGMIALVGCASTPTSQHTGVRLQSVEEPGIAGSPWAACVRAAIPRLDDSQATSVVVAHAAMKACSDEYTNMERTIVSTLAPMCSRDADCTRGALAKVRHQAMQVATDDVVTARVRVAGDQVLKCQ